ncbi:hypothetical protein BDC45DRAFT_578363 [Circinella umbellata]|nr:hypothetical protein BDC45DRAFT_578363 [Circinella umbellata]
MTLHSCVHECAAFEEENKAWLLEPVPYWKTKQIQAEHVSLVYAHRQNNNQDSQAAVIYYSWVWKVGRNTGSVIFDISPCPGIVNEAISKTMETFPKNRGVLIHREGKCIYLKVNLKTDRVPFSSTITIRATMALVKNAKIQKLRLSNLPLLEQDELERGLHTTLSKYGKILDVGINRNLQTKAYMGNGFAVLDIQDRPNKHYTKLDHHVPWCGDHDDLIYANFDQMALYCSRCHEKDHARDDCPRGKRNNQGCYKCGNKTHFADHCPLVKTSEQWLPGGGKHNCHKIATSSKDASLLSVLASKHAPTSPLKQCANHSASSQESIQGDTGSPGSSTLSELQGPELPFGISGTMLIDDATDSMEYHKLGYIEQKMQIDENIRQQACILNLDQDWMDQLHISDVGQILIKETNLNLEWQAILFITLQYKLAQFIQEYETQTAKQDSHLVGVTTRSASQQQANTPSASSVTGAQ